MTNTKYTLILRKIQAPLLALLLLIVPLMPVRAASIAVLGGQDASSTDTDFDGFTIPLRNLPSHAAREYTADLTAYTSSVEECDSDPFVTADGSTTHDGIIAVNWLPFGTKVRFPEIFGDKVFEVHDRMNVKWDDRSKYRARIDIWMEKKADMWQFGVKRAVTVQVVEWGDGKTQWAARAQALRSGQIAMNK